MKAPLDEYMFMKQLDTYYRERGRIEPSCHKDGAPSCPDLDPHTTNRQCVGDFLKRAYAGEFLPPKPEIRRR